MAREDLKLVNQRLDNLIRTTNTASGSVELDNGEEVLFTITANSTSGGRILTQQDLSLYVGSIAVGNELPGGANVTESQWQVIGPWTDWGSTNNINSKTKVFIRNISAGTRTVLVSVSGRLITNSPSTGGSL